MLLKERQTERINVPEKNFDKAREIVLYLYKKFSNCSQALSRNVLSILLYFIDFDYYEKYEEQLIGFTYKKNIGISSIQVVELMKVIKKIDNINIQPNLKILNSRQIKVIDKVCTKLMAMDKIKLWEYLKNDVPWITAQNCHIINYEAVFYRTKKYSMRKYD